jgi:hypothetical protein
MSIDFGKHFGGFVKVFVNGSWGKVIHRGIGAVGGPVYHHGPGC